MSVSFIRAVRFIGEYIQKHIVDRVTSRDSKIVGVAAFVFVSIATGMVLKHYFLKQRVRILASKIGGQYSRNMTHLFLRAFGGKEFESDPFMSGTFGLKEDKTVKQPALIRHVSNGSEVEESSETEEEESLAEMVEDMTKQLQKLESFEDAMACFKGFKEKESNARKELDKELQKKLATVKNPLFFDGQENESDSGEQTHLDHERCRISKRGRHYRVTYLDACHSDSHPDMAEYEIAREEQILTPHCQFALRIHSSVVSHDLSMSFQGTRVYCQGNLCQYEFGAFDSVFEDVKNAIFTFGIKWSEWEDPNFPIDEQHHELLYAGNFDEGAFVKGILMAKIREGASYHFVVLEGEFEEGKFKKGIKTTFLQEGTKIIEEVRV